MNLSSRRTLTGLGISGLVALTLAGASGAFVYVSARDTASAYAGYQREHTQLQADLDLAEQQGYTTTDLRSVTSRLSSVSPGAVPFWFGDRAAYYRHQAASTEQLDSTLKTLRATLLSDARDQADTRIGDAKVSLGHARDMGVVDSDVAPIQKRIDDAVTDQSGARTLGDERALIERARSINSDLSGLIAAQQVENDAVKQAADALKAQTGGNLGAIHGAGSGALAAGRNDAAVASYMNNTAPFTGFDALTRAYNRLERNAGNIGSGDVDQSALAAAGAQRYAGQIHDTLIAGLPVKAIIVNYSDQQLSAYENGKVVQSTPVTTGRPELPTDLGPMKVLYKSSPWTMHSPWPKGSPYWYPDTVVKMVLWFTDTGEGLHDAAWEPDGAYGAGSELNGNVASHGCIHVPLGSEQFLFNWAPNGTPVIVFLGDGSAVSNQLSHITTDAQGNPQTGPKGA
jgi:lipoprotein-anchoring transpeptidase ErfK/SrfK